MIAEICPIKRFSTLQFQQNPIKIIKTSYFADKCPISADKCPISCRNLSYFCR